MTEFISLDQVEWVNTRILKERPELDDADMSWRYRFDLPRPLADWDVFAVWERERIDSMQQHLLPGMVLFDVGTEQGWMNLVYASMVGPENMVLIEPTPEFWGNIRATWEKNYLAPPKAFYAGLFSDKTTDGMFLPYEWPLGSRGPLIDRNSYKYIHEHGDTVPQIRLDDFVDRSGVAPDALTIDVEGAELLVLRGAAATLWQHHPLVWVSIHPDMMFDNYRTTPDQLRSYMAGLGYTGTHLATDHEEHHLFVWHG